MPARAIACACIALAAASAGAPARAQLAATPPTTNEPFAAETCEGGRLLTPEQAAACRAEFERRVEADRARIASARAERLRAFDERARALRGQPHPAGATLDAFLAEQLAHGDVVVTDKGPLVYVGRAGAEPRAEDFVPLDSPRSPLRGGAAREITRKTSPSRAPP